MRKYHIQDREDYHKYVWIVLYAHVRYNKLCGSLRSLIHRLSLLPSEDPYRQQKEAEMLNKLYDMGILGTNHSSELPIGWLDLTLDVGSKPSDIENKVTVSSLARRRLAVVVARLKMSETVSDVSLMWSRCNHTHSRLSGLSNKVISESVHNPSLTLRCSSPVDKKTSWLGLIRLLERERSWSTMTRWVGFFARLGQDRAVLTIVGRLWFVIEGL